MGDGVRGGGVGGRVAAQKCYIPCAFLDYPVASYVSVPLSCSDKVVVVNGQDERRLSRSAQAI